MINDDLAAQRRWVVWRRENARRQVDEAAYLTAHRQVCERDRSARLGNQR